MGETKIEWTDKTWNPLRGCTMRGPGCLNCYAARMAARFNHPGEAYEGLAEMTPHGPRWTNVIKLLPEKLDEPLHWRKPCMVFVNSMSDLFHKDVPEDFIDRAFATMALTPQHTYQILTKRPERMHDYLSGAGTTERVTDRATNLRWRRDGIWRRKPVEWPLPNVWMGPSITVKEHLHWLDYIRRTPAAVRMVSFEPLLESLGDVDLTGIDWAIVGAESGPGARPFRENWAREIRDACQRSGTAFFYKQKMDDSGHKVSLPELDGRVWDEIPSPPSV